MPLTQVLHVNGALVPQARVVDGRVLGVANWRAIAAFGDSQAVDGEARGVCDLLVDLAGDSICLHRDGLWQIFDRAACMTSAAGVVITRLPHIPRGRTTSVISDMLPCRKHAVVRHNK